MALNGSFNTSSYQNRYLIFTWRQVSQNIPANSTTISWELKGAGGTPGKWQSANNIKLIIDGETVFTKDRVELQQQVVASGQKTFYHGTDGNKTFTASASAGIYYHAPNVSGSGKWNLNQIPRKANITSAPNFNDEENPVITYNNPAGNATTALDVCIASQDGDTVIVPYRTVSKTGASYTFNLTTDERNTLLRHCAASNSVPVAFYIQTQIDGKSYYSGLVKTFSVKNGRPTLAPTVQDSNTATYNLTGNRSKLVRGQSNAACVFNDKALKLSSIVFRSVTNGSQALSANGTFNNVENEKFHFSVKDSRGNISEADIACSMVPYFPVTCNMGESNPDTDGNFNLTVAGKCFKGNFGKKQNTLAVKYRYKTTSERAYGDWITLPATWNPDGSYSASKTISGLDYQSSYVFQAQAVDALTAAVTDERTVKTTPVFDWGRDDFSFNVPVAFKQGATGLDGTAINGGTWTPTVEHCSSYSVRYGWYQRQGDTITIGFSVSGTFDSNSNKSQQIKINGVPFAPVCGCFGGGICYNGWISANSFLMGWGVNAGETSITPRTGTIKTSAAGCNLGGALYCNPGQGFVVGGMITMKI